MCCGANGVNHWRGVVCREVGGRGSFKLYVALRRRWISGSLALGAAGSAFERPTLPLSLSISQSALPVLRAYFLLPFHVPRETAPTSPAAQRLCSVLPFP